MVLDTRSMLGDTWLATLKHAAATAAIRNAPCTMHATCTQVTSSTAEALKQQLSLQLKDLDRGIFGVQVSGPPARRLPVTGRHLSPGIQPACALPLQTPQAAKKAELHKLIADLEAQNPVPAPIDNLELVEGNWRLLYSTITITVSRSNDKPALMESTGMSRRAAAG